MELPPGVRKRLEEVGSYYARYVDNTILYARLTGRTLKGNVSLKVLLDRLEVDRYALELAHARIYEGLQRYKAGGWFKAREVIIRAQRRSMFSLPPSPPVQKLLKFLERNPDLVDHVLATYVVHIHIPVKAKVELMYREGNALYAKILKEQLREAGIKI